MKSNQLKNNAFAIGIIRDGYNGHVAKVHFTFFENELWATCDCGSFRFTSYKYESEFQAYLAASQRSLTIETILN